jgi:hypothetical protein
MSTESSSDPELADQMRQQIRVLVREIENLSRSDVAPSEFYEGFLGRIVSAMAAEGGAVWILGEGNRLELVYQINLRATNLADKREEQEVHGRLLRKVITSGEGLLAAPQSGNQEDQSGNPTNFLLVLGTLKNEQETQGIVEVFQRPGGLPNVERGYLRFLSQMCDLAGDYIKTHRLRQFSSRQAMWTQLEQFTRLVHRDLHPQETAYTIANEGRRLIECDRVTVATRAGNKFKVQAISGQEGFDKRSNLVVLLNHLITVVCRSGEPLWYEGDSSNLAPQIEQAIEEYVDESHCKFIAIFPLARPKSVASTDLADPSNPNEQIKPSDVLGALIVEQITEQTLSSATKRRVEVVRDHSALALANATEHHSLFLMPVWRVLGKSRAIVAARNLPKTLSIAGGIIALILALFLWPATLKIESRGTLQPVIKQSIFAAADGMVTDITPLAVQRTVVKKGDILGQISSPELDNEIEKIKGEIDTKKADSDSAQKDYLRVDATPEQKVKIQGQLRSIEASIKSLNQMRSILLERKSKLTIVSPMDGVMTTWDPFQLEGRPVKTGESLLEVAYTGGAWELELMMPEDKMGHILAKAREIEEARKTGKLPKGSDGKPIDYQEVMFVLATHPDIELHGKLSKIHTIAEVHQEDGNIVKLKVEIDRNQLIDRGLKDSLYPGAVVSAKVDCGKSSLGYAWFHDVIAFVQRRILFRFF